MKKTLYIAGKIGNLPIELVNQNFERAKEIVEKLGYSYVSPLDLPHKHDKSWLSHMKEDLTALLKCDGVFAMSNWDDSPGATVEVHLAKNLGLIVAFEIEKK